MNVIKGLIIKDFLNLKTYRTTLIFLVLLFAITSFLNNNISVFIPVFLTLIFGMMGISSFSYDSIAKSDRYLLSFPLTKKDVVKARYLYILMLTFIGVILGFVFSVVLQTIKVGGFAKRITDEALLASIGALGGIIGLQIFEIPVLYFFGAEKGRVIHMAMPVILMLAVSGIAVFFIKVFSIPLEEFLEIFARYGLWIMGILEIIFYFISYKISLKIYQKKEV